MKGILLAGGTGSRLKPLTDGVNKHLLPVGDKPMISHAAEALRLAGVTDLVVVTNVDAMYGFMKVLGRAYDCHGESLQYRVQRFPDGIVGALLTVEKWAEGEPVAVLLADNLFGASLAGVVDTWDGGGAMVLGCPQYDPAVLRASGVPEFAQGHEYEPDWRIERVHEKPQDPPSCCVIPGFYLFDQSVWGRAHGVVPSARGELEITELLNSYAGTRQLSWYSWNRGWIDAGGSIAAYYEAIEYVRRHGVNHPIGALNPT